MALYLVSGGAGFIGSNLAEALLRRGDSVRALDDLSSGRRENLAEAERWRAEGGGSFEFVEGDICDPATCKAAVLGARYVLHQAAVPSVQRSIDDPVRTNRVNVDGTLNLLEASRQAGVRCLVFASSSSIYGESPVLPKVESMPSAPISPYGLQKLAAETYCGLYTRLYGLPTVALRYFNVFGPRQDPASEYSAVIPRFISAIKTGRRPLIFGDGEQSRDFTFIGNVVQANLRAAASGNGAHGNAFNIACGDRITLNDLVRQIAGLLGREVEPEYGDARPGDIRHSQAGIDRAAEHLRYRPEIGFVEGLERTLGAY